MKHTFATLLTLGLLLFGAVPACAESAQEAESRGEAAHKKGDLNLAVAAFSEAIRLDPKLASAYNNRGLAYYDKGDCDKAIADYTAAIRLDPKFALAYRRRGGVYDDQRNYEKAIADFTEAIRLDPQFAIAYCGRADTYEHKGDHDRAIRDSIEAIRLDPQSPRAHNSLGIAYDGYAREIVRIDAEKADALFARAAEYFDGPPAHLADSLKPPLARAGSAGDFKAAAKRLNQAQKQQLLFDYSADAFQAAIEIQPDYDFGNNNLGVYYARRGGPEDVKLAEKYFRGALISNPRYADAFNNLGIILARQGKLDEAIASHKAGLKLRNDRGSDHNNLCRAYLQKGDLDSALKENAISLQCDRNFLGAWMTQAEIRVKQKNLDEAGKCVRKMVAIAANAPETLQTQFMMATKLIEMGRTEMGAKHVEEAVKHLDKGIGWLSQILEVDKSAAEVYNARGVAYLLKGDLLPAKQDFEQVLRLRPQFPGAQEKLNEIQTQLDNPKK